MRASGSPSLSPSILLFATYEARKLSQHVPVGIISEGVGRSFIAHLPFDDAALMLWFVEAMNHDPSAKVTQR